MEPNAESSVALTDRLTASGWEYRDMQAANEFDRAFKAELTALIPHMRAFARSLCRERAEGDDLAQDALLKAWNRRSSFEIGTNMKAWVFMIVRNQFYSDKRRSWRQVQLDPAVAERTLTSNADPTWAVELDEVRRALTLLPVEQREALILVAVAGLPYDEAAAICQCAEGTIKSRVSRGRAQLAQILATGTGAADGVVPSLAMGEMMAQAQALQARAA